MGQVAAERGLLVIIVAYKGAVVCMRGSLVGDEAVLEMPLFRSGTRTILLSGCGGQRDPARPGELKGPGETGAGDVDGGRGRMGGFGGVSLLDAEDGSYDHPFELISCPQVGLGIGRCCPGRLAAKQFQLRYLPGGYVTTMD